MRIKYDERTGAYARLTFSFCLILSNKTLSMEQVFVSLTIDSSGVHSDGIKAFCIKFTSVLNVRNYPQNTRCFPACTSNHQSGLNHLQRKVSSAFFNSFPCFVRPSTGLSAFFGTSQTLAIFTAPGMRPAEHR